MVLDWDELKPRADYIIKWWQSTVISDPKLDHETRRRCGNVLFYLRRLERGEMSNDVKFRFDLQNRIWEAEIWIRAIEFNPQHLK